MVKGIKNVKKIPIKSKAFNKLAEQFAWLANRAKINIFI